ncbi:MAG: M6 family metalloprotease domain-containing protein, partial [Clostridia bacterium]|nr:M6 family metalloprotease domain-containing protein [Clostridia bacterium]
MAIPARNRPVPVQQPDGSTFRMVMSGDEFYRMARTEDGSAVIKGKDGYWCYAFYDIQGVKRSSGVHVSAQNSGSAAAAAARNIPFGMLRSRAMARRAGANRLRAESLKKNAAPDTKAGTVTKKAVIILAEFPTLRFKFGQEYFQDMVNQSGYSYGGATGSALDYFNDQFEGKYGFEFTVGPVVTLSKEYAYYGENDDDDFDKRPQEAVAEACRLSDSLIDFSQFDGDNDGEVDNVFVFVAGHDEAEGAGADHIWSHQWTLSSAGIRLVLDGKSVNSYAISTELTHSDGTWTEIFATIGTFCHEYSHVLGLMDLYDTDYEDSGGSSPSIWGTTGIMDHGNYNNSGNTPPNYNAMELYSFGIGNMETLETGQQVLAPLSSQKRYFVSEADVDGEYYIFECRAAEGWDRYIGGSGMLIYHVDRSSNDAGYSTGEDRNLNAAERWWYNEVNANPDHQCMDLIEALPLATDV